MCKQPVCLIIVFYILRILKKYNFFGKAVSYYGMNVTLFNFVVNMNMITILFFTYL